MRRTLAAVGVAAALGGGGTLTAWAAGAFSGGSGAGPVARAPAAPRDAATAAAKPAAKLDLRTSLGHDAPFLKRFDVSAIYTGASPDSIPAIDRPVFDSPKEASKLLPDTSLVIGYEHAGDARAYPVDLLSLHEVVNDTVGGKPVTVTWCPLCSTAFGFDPVVQGKRLDFHISGYLFHANQILYDTQTGSLWSQLLGGAVTGPFRGTRLGLVPLVTTTWQEWREAHPDTKVLSIARDRFAGDFTHPRSFVTARGIAESDSPYSDYNSKVPIYYPRTIRGVPDSERVIGVELRGKTKAYPLSTLKLHGALNDTLAGKAIVVTFDNEALNGSVFSREVGGRVLTFGAVKGNRLVDRETKSVWSPVLGKAVAGPLKGVQLERLSASTSFWFAWRAFNPDTAIAK